MVAGRKSSFRFGKLNGEGGGGGGESLAMFTVNSSGKKHSASN